MTRLNYHDPRTLDALFQGHEHSAFGQLESSTSTHAKGAAMKNPRLMLAFAICVAILLAGVNFATTSTKNTGLVAVPARAGAVVGTTQNSDEFIWRLFAQFAAPVGKSPSSQVQFETWASDEGFCQLSNIIQHV
jgi:hypothetical protein